MKPRQGTGYYLYKFLGESSFVYFLDGKTFSMNEKDHPGKAFIFIDDFAYESNLTPREDIAKYIQSSKPVDILRDQAKQEQDHFKLIDPTMVIKDYGPSATKNPDGTDDRLFYLWRKESPPGSKPATQYMVSTLVKDGVVVLSLMPLKASITEADIFSQIEKYTTHFNLVSSDRCAKVLAAPTAP